jgi:hypothetical protein
LQIQPDRLQAKAAAFSTAAVDAEAGGAESMAASADAAADQKTFRDHAVNGAVPESQETAEEDDAVDPAAAVSFRSCEAVAGTTLLLSFAFPHATAITGRRYESVM